MIMASQKIIIDNKGQAQVYKCIISDCMGNEISSKQIKLNQGISVFDVPPSGLVQFVTL